MSNSLKAVGLHGMSATRVRRAIERKLARDGFEIVDGEVEIGAET